MKWKLNIILYIIVILLILIPITFGGGYMEYLTKGWADTLYCKLTGCTMEGDIDMDGYDILNATIVAMNRTNATELCLNSSCIGDWGEVINLYNTTIVTVVNFNESYVNETGDTMTGNLNLKNATLESELAWTNETSLKYMQTENSVGFLI